MTTKPLVALTCRIPEPCMRRLEAAYRVRPGDDARVLSPAELVAHAEGAAALMVYTADKVTAGVIGALGPQVRVISTISVGFEHVDLAAARTRGIRVTNTPGVLTDATADVALLLLLGASRRAHEGDMLLRSGKWPGIRPTLLLGTQITGKTLGIVGMGRIGAATAARAKACGMKVIYHGRREAPPDMAGGAEFHPVLEDMLPKCDVLSLHCPLTPETRKILNERRIALLPRGAIVVNTARGDLVDDGALIAALKSGHVAAAGLDVFTNEPALDPRYLDLPNVFLQPHIGSGTVETRVAMGMLAIDNIDAVLAGREPPHAVV